jgi:hypothetical protein
MADFGQFLSNQTSPDITKDIQIQYVRASTVPAQKMLHKIADYGIY